MSLATRLNANTDRVIRAGERTAEAWEQIAAASEKLAVAFNCALGYTAATIILPEPGVLALEDNGEVEVAPAAEAAKVRKGKK